MSEHQTVTGIIKYWTIYMITDQKELRAIKHFYPNCIPAVATGLVVQDFKERFAADTAMKTSYLMSFDLKTMRLYTLNSVYQLEGEGRITYEDMPPYDIAVGDEMTKYLM